MVKSLGLTFNVFAKDLYAILAPIEPQQILNVCVSTCSTESGGNVVVDLFHVGNFRDGTTIEFGFLVENRLKVR